MTISNAISSALKGDSRFTLDADELLAASGQTDRPVVLGRIDFPGGAGTPAGLTSLMALLPPEYSLSDWLPDNDALAGLQAKIPIQLESFEYAVATSDKSIIRVVFTVNLSTIAPLKVLDTPAISLAPTGLRLALQTPLDPQRQISAEFDGVLTLGNLKLATRLDLPDFRVSVKEEAENPPLTLADALTGFGIPTFDAAERIAISLLQIDFSVPDAHFSFDAEVDISEENPLTLFKDIALRKLSFSLAY